MKHLFSMLWTWMRSLLGTTAPLGPISPSPENLRPVYRLRVPPHLLEQMRADLHRPHPFARERVGLLLAREASGRGERLLLAHRYEPLREDEYLEDRCVGARINREAIRRMLALALDGESVFHVHLHEHSGMPGFSAVDEENLRELLPSFCSAGPRSIHGALLLSHDQGLSWGWEAGRDGPIPFSSITIVGSPLLRWEASS